MARVAFVMDKILRKIGLSGRASCRMLVGFGRSAPRFHGDAHPPPTATGDDDLLTPFMSVLRQAAIYSLLAVAFFPERARS